MIENMAKQKFKSKLDLRSGFWQVGLTERAKDLTAFTIPNGRCFRWNCMPFGLQGAPGIFQEMMELLIQKVKLQPNLRQILSQTFLGAFFDDCGLGTDNEEDHLKILEELLKVCQANNIRIKLSKCDFMQEEIDYLGFNIGWGTWKPCKTKVEAIMRIEVKNLKDLRKFLGVLNFYRRHIPNVTYSSAILTDLTKKDAKWQWTKIHQEKFLELKIKLAQLSSIGFPKPTGEVILISDASDIGGGSTLFQWQQLERKQIPEKFQTTGLKYDGTLKHNYPAECRLVPLGHWNWKWNPTRQKYNTYE